MVGVGCGPAGDLGVPGERTWHFSVPVLICYHADKTNTLVLSKGWLVRRWVDG